MGYTITFGNGSQIGAPSLKDARHAIMDRVSEQQWVALGIAWRDMTTTGGAFRLPDGTSIEVRPGS